MLVFSCQAVIRLLLNLFQSLYWDTARIFLADSDSDYLVSDYLIESSEHVPSQEEAGLCGDLKCSQVETLLRQKQHNKFIH